MRCAGAMHAKAKCVEYGDLKWLTFSYAKGARNSVFVFATLVLAFQHTTIASFSNGVPTGSKGGPQNEPGWQKQGHLH
jgi:hypothetical protein